MTRAAVIAAAVAALLLAAARPAAGQGGGRLFVSGGVQVVDTDELNRMLEAEGLPTLDEEHVTLGLGLDRQSGRWIVGAEAMLLLDEEKSSGGFDRSLGGRYGLVEAGFVFPLGGTLRIYPLAGLGWSDLDFTTSRDDDVAFGELLEGPGPGSEVSTGGLLLQPGLGVDLVAGGFSIGIRGGYTFRPGDAEWSADDVDIDGGPDVGVQGGFLRATIGLAGG